MKKMFNVRSIVAMIIMATIATTAFAGCNHQSAGGNQSSLAPSLSVSEVRQDEKSKVESKVEISKDEKSKDESKVESSKDEKSKVESSKEEPSKVENSVTEKSEVESSVEEKSHEESNPESSVVEQSKVESSFEESSKEVSVETSNVESSVNESSEIVSIKDAIRYGKVTYPQMVTESNGSETMMAPGDYIAILREEADFYIFFICGDYASILKENVELFPENYSPNFDEGNWYATLG